jgi:hypothetical protein
MYDPCLFESDKYARPTLLWTWLTATSTHSVLGVNEVQTPWVWQTWQTHIYLGLANVYLGLTNMSDPLYFGHGWLPSPDSLGLANISDPRLLWTWLVATSIHFGLGVLSLENRPNPRLFRSATCQTHVT